jgi:hypothetical protein
VTLMSDVVADWDEIIDTSEHGEVITYTPVAKDGEGKTIAPFTTVAVLSKIAVDALIPGIVRDTTECRMNHSELVKGKITAPETRYERNPGDTITYNGTWDVIDAQYEYGMWILTLEKNIRVVHG